MLIFFKAIKTDPKGAAATSSSSSSSSTLAHNISNSISQFALKNSASQHQHQHLVDANNNSSAQQARKLPPGSLIDSSSSRSSPATTSSSSGYHSTSGGSHPNDPVSRSGHHQAASGEAAADLNSENEQFLKDCLTSVLEGQGVGLFKFNRVKRLMEDENYRNFVLSRLNTSLDKKLANDEEHIECVRVSKPVFKGMAKLLSAIIYGLEQTYANNGLGGMASAFQLLEIAHTHYCVESEVVGAGAAVRGSSASGGGDAASTGGGGNMSPMSERSNSPPLDRRDSNGMTASPSSSQFQNFTGFQIQTTGSIVAQLGMTLINS